MSFQDAERMHVVKKAPAPRKNGIPAWAMNDAQLREVVLCYCERYVFLRTAGRTPTGSIEERIAALRAKCAAILPSKEEQLRLMLEQHTLLKGDNLGRRDFTFMVQNRDRQVRVLRKGLLETITAVAVYSYRLGHNSPEVAEELGLSPAGVREMLYRLNLIANGKGTVKKQYTRRWKDRPIPVVPWPKEKTQEMLRLRLMGYSRSEVAKILGICGNTLLTRWKYEFGDLTVEGVKARAMSTRIRAGAWTDERLRLLFILRCAGLSWVACAKRLGSNQSYLLKVWRKNFGDLNCVTVKRAA
ncbi:MAG TPA: hypothetical protein VJN92_15640 [Candidatus Acidoferrum sp.]|nr:hypothetical protein [Candidatus Acidoferrum sp.]